MIVLVLVSVLLSVSVSVSVSVCISISTVSVLIFQKLFRKEIFDSASFIKTFPYISCTLSFYMLLFTLLFKLFIENLGGFLSLLTFFHVNEWKSGDQF